MKTRTANHKTARCETCPYFFNGLTKHTGVCALYSNMIDWPTVEPDSFCGHHPDNEPLVENEKKAKEKPFSKFYRKIPPTANPCAGYGEIKGLVKSTL